MKNSNRLRPSRRGFTMIEVLIAGLVAVFVVGSVTLSMSRLGRAKHISLVRYTAYMRADAALNAMRTDAASIVRAADLFYTRVRIYSENVNTPGGHMPRDELLMFTNRLRPLRDVQYNGEGTEYESQFRVEEDELGLDLLHRRDPLPDEYPAGGGVVTPVAEGIVGLRIEAYDGLDWTSEWESDDDGLPLALRITVTASGSNDFDTLYEAPLVTLRTVVALDRVPIPMDLVPLAAAGGEDEDGQEVDDAAAAAADAAAAAGVDLDAAALEAVQNGQRVRIGPRTDFQPVAGGGGSSKGARQPTQAPQAKPTNRGDATNVTGGRGPR